MENTSVDLRLKAISAMRSVQPKRGVRQAEAQASQRDVTVFQRIYTTARKKVDVGYDAPEIPTGTARKVASKLRNKHVDQTLWPQYVDEAFRFFSFVSGRRYPPLAFLASDTMIDRFASTIPPRKINMERLRKFLKRICSEEDPDLVAAILRTALECDATPPQSVPRQIRHAVSLAVASFKAIGYEPIGAVSVGRNA